MNVPKMAEREEMPTPNESNPMLIRNHFLLNLTGEIQSASFLGETFDSVRVKCFFRTGSDWALVTEDEMGVDHNERYQTSGQAQGEVSNVRPRKKRTSNDNLSGENVGGNVSSSSEEGLCFVSQMANKTQDERQLFIWNLPLEATFKSTNVFGWPQIILVILGVDAFGREVVRGYGWRHLPTLPGMHKLQISLYRPESTSLLNRLTAWFIESRRPEFVDASLAAGNDGRELVLVCNGGVVNLQLNVLLKDFRRYGFVSRTEMTEKATTKMPKQLDLGEEKISGNHFCTKVV